MREILFKAKRLDNGEWVEGNLAEFINYLDGDNKFGIQIIKCVPSSMDRFIPAWETELIEIDPLTIGQFTGLSDKNGKKIFEGDICNWKSTAYSNAVPYVANYSNSDCRFVLRGKVDTIPMWDGLEIEVIGNIHDKEQ